MSCTVSHSSLVTGHFCHDSDRRHRLSLLGPQYSPRLYNTPGCPRHFCLSCESRLLERSKSAHPSRETVANCEEILSSPNSYGAPPTTLSNETAAQPIPPSCEHQSHSNPQGFRRSLSIGHSRCAQRQTQNITLTHTVSMLGPIIDRDSTKQWH
jgi:hypothetical protein